MDEHGSLPRARKDGLLVETAGEELLLYDQDSHTAHCLSPLAACVWRHCDGEHDVPELAELARTSEDVVAQALHELREKDLLDSEPALSAIPGESRREAIGRIVRVGAAAAAAPLIVSATAATPAIASSNPKCGTAVTSSSCCVCLLSTSVDCYTSEPEVNESECKKLCEHIGGTMKEFKAKRGCE